MSSSRPYMQLYVADYLGDTMHLTTEQHGAYLLLLMTAWRTDGLLPNDPKKLARIVGLTPAKWKKIANDVLDFFEVSDQKITHKRITSEIKKVKEMSEKRKHAGAKGGAAKSLKDNETGQASATDLPKHTQTSDFRDQSKEEESEPDLLDEQVPKPVDQCFSLYQQIAQGNSWPVVQKLTDKRKRALAARIDEYGLEKMEAAIKRAARSPFLLGDNDRKWKADFDFLTRSDSIAKIMEGKYDGAQVSPASVEDPWMRRVRSFVDALWNGQSVTWLDSWGPNPLQDGCMAPVEVLSEFSDRIEEIKRRRAA